MRISDWSSDVCSSDLEEVDQAADGCGLDCIAERHHRKSAPAHAVAARSQHHRVSGEQMVDGGGQALSVQDHDGEGDGRSSAHDPEAHRCAGGRSEEHTSELQSLMSNSYAVFCLKKQTYHINVTHKRQRQQLNSTATCSYR